MQANDPFMKSAGDYMAAAIDIMVHTHEIDARSPAADARLCWGKPWPLAVAREIFNNAGHRAQEQACPGRGRCHGCMNWCDSCGDVSEVCDDTNCDQHRKKEG